MKYVSVLLRSNTVFPLMTFSAAQVATCHFVLRLLDLLTQTAIEEVKALLKSLVCSQHCVNKIVM